MTAIHLGPVDPEWAQTPSLRPSAPSRRQAQAPGRLGRARRAQESPVLRFAGLLQRVQRSNSQMEETHRARGVVGAPGLPSQRVLTNLVIQGFLWLRHGVGSVTSLAIAGELDPQPPPLTEVTAEIPAL